MTYSYMVTFGNPQTKQLKKAWEEFNGLRSSLQWAGQGNYPPVKALRTSQPSLMRHEARLQLKQDVNQSLNDGIEATKGRAIRANEKPPTYRPAGLTPEGHDRYESIRKLPDATGYVGFPHRGYGEEPIPSHLVSRSQLISGGNSQVAQMDFLEQRYNQIRANKLMAKKNLSVAPAKYLEEAYRGSL